MKQKLVGPPESLWREQSPRDFRGSPSERIGHGWMLITAGNARPDGSGDWNAMTASWGGLGVLWGRNVAFMFIRPSRRTFEFANANGLFTLSFFSEARREALNIMGSRSGRDCDKAAAAGLSPLIVGENLAGAPGAAAIGFKEAEDILICRALYTHDLDPRKFLDAPLIEEAYHGKDYHRMYIGEILKALTR